jgi:hypothetical protein
VRASNAVLLTASIIFSLAAAEGAVRLIDGPPVFTGWLSNGQDRDLAARLVNLIPAAEGVSSGWFFRDPPPLPNRGKPPADWVRYMEDFKESPPWVVNAFHAPDFFRAYNADYVDNPCSHPGLMKAPGSLYVFDPVDHSPYPRLRLLPSATTPTGLVTNEVGWRGAPVKLEKPVNVIRIVFVGASTTANSDYQPYSYPELVGGWLNIWATSRKTPVRFETLNAGRVGIVSTDIEAIVRKEVLPFRPELVVYLEGGNTLTASELIKTPPPPPPKTGSALSKAGLSKILSDASNKSAIARRLHYALHLVDPEEQLRELPKPAHEILWPAHFDLQDPDLTRLDLPLKLSTAIADLDRIRTDLSSVGSELALSSYKFFVHDGLTLDPVWNRNLYEQLNVALFPLTYRELEELVSFQNRVYAKYARIHGLPFIDVAQAMPNEPDLYIDPVHFSYGGTRLHAWIVFQALVALIERKIGEGVWPMPAHYPNEVPAGLYFQPRLIPVSCSGD